MNLQMAIKSFSAVIAFLCAHCGAECETPSCKTVVEAKEALAFLDAIAFLEVLKTAGQKGEQQ